MTYGERDRFLVPLDSPPARRWFRESLYVPHGRIARLLRPRLRRTSETTGIDHLLALLDEVPDAVPSATAVYVRDYARSLRGRVLGFFFDDDAREPSVVAKAQFAKIAPSLRIEAQTLEQMRAFLPPALQPTLPRVLRFHESPRGELLVLSMLPGRSAYVEMHQALAPSRRVDAHFDAASQWLAAFHDATRTTATTLVNGVRVPHSASHGDFWPRNILFSGGGHLARFRRASSPAALASGTMPDAGGLEARPSIGIVDWEHFVPAASPFADLFHFAVAYGAAYFTRTTEEEAFRKTFAANNRVSRAVQRYLRDYATRAGLPHKVLLPAFRMFLESRGRGSWAAMLRA